MFLKLSLYLNLFITIQICMIKNILVTQCVMNNASYECVMYNEATR